MIGWTANIIAAAAVLLSLVALANGAGSGGAVVVAVIFAGVVCRSTPGKSSALFDVVGA